jgi:UDP-glucose:(heptosyl)LPS alpha-1,3-glucosyltransferase
VAERAGGVPEVTIVANDIGPEGGMERQLRVLVEGLLAGGTRVTVIAWTCSLAPHPGLRWVRVPGRGRPFALGYPWFLLCASLLVALRGRGLIHSTGAIVLNRTDVCTVHFCHHALAAAPGFSRASRPGFAHRANAWVVRRLSLLAERWCYRPARARALVGVSAGVAKELRERFPAMAGRVGTIPNGVDTDAFSPANRAGGASADDSAAPADLIAGPEEARLQALFVGGDWGRKGLGPAIEALASCPRTELTVVGEGDAGEYGRLAARAGVGDRVRFAGPTTDPAAWYRRADVFLLPTAYETFSLVSYEAAACGLPLLVTRVNGVEDLLVDSENGWFVERDPAAIAARLRQLRDDPQLRRRLGAAARVASLEYSWERMIERYRELYAELAAGAGR